MVLDSLWPRTEITMDSPDQLSTLTDTRNGTKAGDEFKDHGSSCAASRAGSPQSSELSAVAPRASEVTSM
jgi:hypothetical protein